MIVQFKKVLIVKKQRPLYTKGALLLELLVVISLLAIILSASANGVFLSLRSNKISGERDVAYALASESLEAARATGEKDWLNIYSLTKSTQHYKTIQSSGSWILATGDETVSLNNISYTRYITIDNVSRDGTTRLIQTSYSSADDDPSTQKVTATVSWLGGTPVVISSYVFRFKNDTCVQSTWTTLDSGNTVHNCTDASFDSKDSGIDVTSGSIKLE